MNEELYEFLLRKSKWFCSTMNVDYIDFIHDLICETDVTYTNYNRYFVSKRRKMNESIKLYEYREDRTKRQHLKYVDLDNVDIPTKMSSHYEECSQCKLIMPESELAGNGEKICKNDYNKRNVGRERNSVNHKENQKKLQKNSRASLSDSYIKDILRKQGTVITNSSIKEKREGLLEKRRKKYEKLLLNL